MPSGKELGDRDYEGREGREGGRTEGEGEEQKIEGR